MGNFSRQTFDRLKHYVGVRLQQGVPIVDADWNEQDDVRRFELQAFLKWFVGDGVPLGNDGFRVTPAAVANDFGIAAGRCLVEGWDVINDSDQNQDGAGSSYRSQPLFGNDALAAAWGVAPLPPLTTPGAPRTDTVYLDVWEREVGALEDPGVVNPAIGIETSVRIRREWVVRVLEGSVTLPKPPAGHVYYELANLVRPAGAADIGGEQITDLRRTGLTLVSQRDLQQIMSDAYGPAYALDMDGRPNLKVSLREAVNALLRNQLPGTQAASFSDEPRGTGLGRSGTLTDSHGMTWVFRYSQKSGSAAFWYRRYDPATGTWTEDTELVTDSIPDAPVFVVEDHAANLWVFWMHIPPESGALYTIWYNVYLRVDEGWMGEEKLTEGTTRADLPRAAVVDDRGGVWVFWMSFPAGGGALTLWCRRFDPASWSWDRETQLTLGPNSDSGPEVVVDGRGDIWAFWWRNTSGNNDIWCNRFDAARNAWVGESRLTSHATADMNPAPVVDQDGSVWLFWSSDRNGRSDVFYNRLNPATGAWGVETQLIGGNNTYDTPGAPLLDTRGDLWLFGESGDGQTSTLWYRRFNRDSGWGHTVQLASGPGVSSPVGVLDAEGDVWVFWQRIVSGKQTLWYRKLITEI